MSTPPFKNAANKVKMVMTPSPNEIITDTLEYGDSTHFVSAVFNKGHFVVLYYDIKGYSVTVFDGLDMPISNWHTHIVHTIRTYGMVSLQATSTFILVKDDFIDDEGESNNNRKCAKKKGRRNMSARIDFTEDGRSWLISNDTSFKQTDGFNCGPIACMKIMEIYGFIAPGTIGQSEDYRSVVLDYYRDAIVRFDGVLRCRFQGKAENKDKKTSREAVGTAVTRRESSRNKAGYVNSRVSKVPATEDRTLARKTDFDGEMHGKVRANEIRAGSVDAVSRRKSPRIEASEQAREVIPGQEASAVAKKLSGIFETVGKDVNTTWSIHRFIISGTSGMLGMTIKKTETGSVVVSKLNQRCMAFRHGIRERDIVLGSVGIDVEENRSKEIAQTMGWSSFNELRLHPECIKECTDIEEKIATTDPDLLKDLIEQRMEKRPFIMEVIRRKYPNGDLRADPWQDYHLHRFIIPEIENLGTLGMDVEEKWRDTKTKYLKLTNVMENGTASFFGLRNDDVLCIQGSNGKLMLGSVKDVKVGWEKRPLTVEVLRRVQFPAF